VLGQLKNAGKSGLRISMLELKFLDSDGRFIDQCTAFTYGLEVKAGANESFKASCSASMKSPTAAAGGSIMPSTLKHYSKVEVRARGAYKTGGWGLFPY
jgi:hypothetical protein